MLLALFAVAVVLRIGLVGRSSLWGDELFSLATATGHSLEQPAAAADPKFGDFVEPDHPVPATEFQRYLKHDHPPASPARVIRAVFLSDTSPPLYYLLLYGWTLIFGTSDVALRLFSTTCSLGCLPFFVGIARRTGGRAAVLPTCVLFAFSPLAIYYSTEGRMYSLLWLCVLATIWASLVLHQRGGGFPVYVLWVVASAGGFLTHYFFLFSWMAIVAYLLITPGKLGRLHLSACVMVTGVLILPWYAKLPETFSKWRVTQGWLKMVPGYFNRPAASLELVVQFFSGRAPELWLGHRKAYIAAVMLFGIVAAVMVWRLRMDVFSRRRGLLWLLFLAACAGPLVYDLVEHTYMAAKPRYAIGALPAAYLLAAVGLACLRARPRIIMLVLIVLAWAPNGLSIYRNRWRSWSPFREISRAASVNGSASDLILVHSIPSGVLGMARYASGPAPLASWVGQLGTRRVPESLQMLTAGRTRILFVRVHDVGEPAPEGDWLRANAVVSNEAHLGIGTIVDFRPKGAETF
jgi:4-amino-4-deoxy-L-arabinose transferase-like glycosyltransferase